jgi:cell division protein FtsI (penicillin-binding protein 3)
LTLFNFNKNSNSIRPTPKTVEDEALQMCHNRLLFGMAAICLVFSVLIFRLFEISLSSNEDLKLAKNYGENDFVMQRSAIQDRNGSIIAVNLTTASLYINPSKVVEKQYASEKLCKIFPSSKCSDIKSQIDSDKTFAWLKRHLTPAEQQYVHDLGIAGVSFLKDEKRVYPHANLFAHVLGYVDVDGDGLSGVEKYFDDRLKNTNEPLTLSVDVRIQEILREEILAQAVAHNAIGGSGVIMDVHTGEIIAMTSVPDFDPHNVAKATERQRFNQATLGDYEMGSTLKLLTLAMGLDGKQVGINDVFNTDQVIKVGNKQIHNYRNKGGIMSTPEVIMYSSNVGLAQIGLRVGLSKQQSYLGDFGLLAKAPIELPEVAYPLYPSKKMWTQASLITISFGHGIAITPLHVARAISAVVNGGYLVKPTLVKVDNQDEVEKVQVISEKTSDTMRRIMRLIVTKGYGKKAEAQGYFVGGKTGTAEKVVGRTYAKHANIASFVGAFPIHEPKYAIVVLIDEATANKENGGFTTGGMVAAPVVGRIIEKIAPILDVKPFDAEDPKIVEKLSLEYQAKNPASFR